MKKYYLLSLKHTHPKDSHITLWRPNDAGYTIYKESSGIYEEIKQGYHDNGQNTIPIEDKILEGLWSKEIENGKFTGRVYLPNTAENWQLFGVKKTKKGLERMQ